MDRVLWAASDLHVGVGENKAILQDRAIPNSSDDWLLLAGDIAERIDDFHWALALLVNRFKCVIWCPGNHELWTLPRAENALRGVARYEELVAVCRSLGVLTPEDPYPLWSDESGAVRIASVFLLYDYSYRLNSTWTKADALAHAFASGIVCTDEALLHSDPFGSKEEWCRARVAWTEARLAQCDPTESILVLSHWPLVRQPTEQLRHPDFALWCGTVLTAHWHHLFPIVMSVYGHLHMPRTLVIDEIPFMDVSLGYAREWQSQQSSPEVLHRVLPIAPRT